LGIRTEQELLLHPTQRRIVGRFVIEEVIKAVYPDEAYFWARILGLNWICSLLRMANGSRGV